MPGKVYAQTVTKSLKKELFLGFFVAMLFALMAHYAHAAARDPQLVRKEFNQTFEQMIARPTDVPLALKYSKLAVEMGDYESAIPPLERVLMFNPELPEIRLEVGVLYYLLHSNDQARTYLVRVKNDAKATPAQKSRADSYLAKL